MGTHPAEGGVVVDRQPKNGDKLTAAELRATIARMDELTPKWNEYRADRKAAKSKRRSRAAFAEYETLYRRVRRSGLTLAEARKKVAKK